MTTDYDKGRASAMAFKGSVSVQPYDPVKNEFQHGWNDGLSAPAETMTYKGDAWTVTVPPGMYFLGDPAYAVPREMWQALIEGAGYFDRQPVGTTEDDHQVLAFNAPDVPGQFHDGDGTPYLCDSGLLGLVPAALVGTDQKRIADLITLGRFIEYDREFTCTSDGQCWSFGEVNLVEDPQESDD
jgi:hypothetical protein